jgi:uncharacterized protein (TIGR00369 family)
MTEAELAAFLDARFPQVRGEFAVERLTDDGLILRLKVAEKHLRPGDTVSGPTMFGLADVAFYLALLARIGPVALAVTTGVSMDFMRKPGRGADLLATARLLKLGRQLAVGDVLIRAEGDDAVLARAALTYAIPLDARS